MEKKCEHGRRLRICKDCGGSAICIHHKQKRQCKECGGKSICKHNRNKSSCKICKGSGICEHQINRSGCKKCGGSSICKHNRQKSRCKECVGSEICEHNKTRSVCKKCGTYRKFLKGEFTSEQIKEMGEIKICQFPNCLISNLYVPFRSDHFHDGHSINVNNYRGEICRGHNLLLADLDKHPEEANLEALEYMNRRPYRRN